MNFVTLHVDGKAVRVNVSRILSYEGYGDPQFRGDKAETAITMIGGGVLWVDEKPEAIDKFVSGMHAFTGHIPGCTYTATPGLGQG